MTLNGVMTVTLRYFTEFGKPALQKTMCGGIYARIYCIFSACTMSSQRKFTFAISSPDEFLVIYIEREYKHCTTYRRSVNIYYSSDGLLLAGMDSRSSTERNNPAR